MRATSLKKAKANSEAGRVVLPITTYSIYSIRYIPSNNKIKMFVEFKSSPVAVGAFQGKRFSQRPLARDEHAGRTSVKMGHRNPNTTFQYYVDTVEEESDVEVYWSLTPMRVKELAKTSPSG